MRLSNYWNIANGRRAKLLTAFSRKETPQHYQFEIKRSDLPIDIKAVAEALKESSLMSLTVTCGCSTIVKLIKNPDNPEEIRQIGGGDA